MYVVDAGGWLANDGIIVDLFTLFFYYCESGSLQIAALIIIWLQKV